MIRETRRLCLLFALVIGSKLCLFHKEVAIDEQNSWTGLGSEPAFPFMVASWTTGSKISIRPRTFSTNSKHPAGLTPLYSSATTTESIVNGSESMKAEMFQPTVRIHRLPSVSRVHCISDLHVDNAENMKWLESRCRANSTVEDPIFAWDDTDLIIVAGDISHSLTKIEDSLALLKETGAHVVFVPGNHEAWLSQAQKKEYDNDGDGVDPDTQRYDSIRKLEDIEFLCQQLGVYTTGDCLCVGEDATKIDESTPSEELWILPLDSWYDGSLSFVDLRKEDSSPHYDFVEDFRKWPWVDFWQCRWPEALFPEETIPLLQEKIPIGAVDYFLNRNQPVIGAFHNAIRSNATESKRVSVLTVTHFLPNSQSLPDWKELEAEEFDFGSWLDHGAGGTSAKFALVGGSDKIDAQIRSLSLNNSEENGGFYNRIHVFGHSHRPKDFVHKGIRYVHNPLGKPREREMHMVAPDIGPKLLWEAGRDNLNCDNERIIRYWEEQGGGPEMLRQRLATQTKNRKLFYKKRNLREQE